MEISIVKSTYNSYGGTFSAPFTYLYQIIADKFAEHQITFPYKEIEIGLAYPSNSRRKNKDYNEWFEKLPNYYRGKNKVKATIPIENSDENLNTIFDLLNSAFELVLKKKKKTDDYNSQKVVDVLSELKKEMSEVDLWELHTKQRNLITEKRIAKILKNRQERENSNTENKRLIQDIRLYTTFNSNGKNPFLPYSGQFCDKILEKLRKVKFRLPDYTHLYINVSDTFENALYDTLRLYSWYAYGIAIYEDFENYEKLKEEDKKRVIFDLIKEGLYDTAKIDKLDINVLTKVINKTETEIFKNQ